MDYQTAKRAIELNRVSAGEFVRAVGPVAERAEWVAERAWHQGPFAGTDELFAALRAAILGATREEQLALLRGHPELAGREAEQGTMTVESTTEQGRLGLNRLEREQLVQLQSLNRAYRERFGFPLIVALCLHESLDSVFAQAGQRLLREQADEWPAALEEVCAVMRSRLDRIATLSVFSFTPERGLS